MKKFVRFAMFTALVVFAAAAFALTGGKETKTASAATVNVSTEGGLLTALENVDNGDIIKLTGDITLSDGLFINNRKSFAVDTNGYTLFFNNKGLSITNGSGVNFPRSANLSGLLHVQVYGASPATSAAMFTGGLTLVGEGASQGLYAGDGAQVTVNGDIISSADGVYALGAGTVVTVNGKIDACDRGVWAASGASVAVTDDITSETSYGVYAISATVNVAGGVAGGNSSSMVVYASSATVTVNGGVYAPNGTGVVAQFGTNTVTIVGGIISDKVGGLHVSGKWTTVTVTGAVTGKEYGVWAQDGAKAYIIGTVSGDAGDICIAKTGSETEKEDKIFASGSPLYANGLEYGDYYWDVYTEGTHNSPAFVYVRQSEISAGYYEVTFGAGEGGAISATVDGQPINSGDLVAKDKTVIFTATPDEGCRVSSWFVNSFYAGDDDTYTIYGIGGAADIQVYFAPKTYNVGVTVVDWTGGGAGSDFVAAAHGTTVTVSTSPWDGWRVKAWTINGVVMNGSNSLYVITGVNKDYDITVEFELIPDGEEDYKSVNFNVVGGNGALTAKAGGVTVPAGAWVAENASVVFTAAPAAGYRVKEWKLDGVVIAGNKTNAYTHADLTANILVTVEFEAIPSSGNPEQTPTDQTPAEKQPDSGKPEKGKLGGGAIAGIVIGSVAVAGIGGFCVYWFVLRKKKA